MPVFSLGVWVRERFNTALSARSSHEHTVFMIVASVLGIACGLMAVVLEKLIEFFKAVFFTIPAGLFPDHPSVYAWLLISRIPAVGGPAAGYPTLWV